MSRISLLCSIKQVHLKVLEPYKSISDRFRLFMLFFTVNLYHYVRNSKILSGEPVSHNERDLSRISTRFDQDNTTFPVILTMTKNAWFSTGLWSLWPHNNPNCWSRNRQSAMVKESHPNGVIMWKARKCVLSASHTYRVLT